MKEYFKFRLTGKAFLPVWLLFMVLFVAPYSFVQYKLQGFQPYQAHEALQVLSSMLQWYVVLFFLMIIEYVFIFIIVRMSIENTAFKEKSFSFNGRTREFLGVFIPGFILTIITFGIYSPWFMKNVYSFFSRKTSYNSENFEFKGKGEDLFLIILFTIFIPMLIILVAVMIFSFSMIFSLSDRSQFSTPDNTLYTVFMVLVVLVIMIPSLYFVYKWMVDLKYKNYTIRWETKFWNAGSKMVQEILLSVITLGIYLPLAILRLYKYFAERTIARSPEKSKKFGYDIDPWNDFLFIWGQVLLTFITLGIYYAWAYCRISERIMNKTFVEEIAVDE